MELNKRTEKLLFTIDNHFEFGWLFCILFLFTFFFVCKSTLHGMVLCKFCQVVFFCLKTENYVERKMKLQQHFGLFDWRISLIFHCFSRSRCLKLVGRYKIIFELIFFSLAILKQKKKNKIVTIVMALKIGIVENEFGANFLLVKVIENYTSYSKMMANNPFFFFKCKLIV